MQCPITKLRQSHRALHLQLCQRFATCCPGYWQWRATATSLGYVPSILQQSSFISRPQDVRVHVSDPCGLMHSLQWPMAQAHGCRIVEGKHAHCRNHCRLLRDQQSAPHCLCCGLALRANGSKILHRVAQPKFLQLCLVHRVEWSIKQSGAIWRLFDVCPRSALAPAQLIRALRSAAFVVAVLAARQCLARRCVCLQAPPHIVAPCSGVVDPANGFLNLIHKQHAQVHRIEYRTKSGLCARIVQCACIVRAVMATCMLQPATFICSTKLESTALVNQWKPTRHCARAARKSGSPGILHWITALHVHTLGVAERGRKHQTLAGIFKGGQGLRQ